MEFFEALARRRSIRNYSSTPVPEAVVRRAIDAALAAPNSSNMQTWDIHWVRSSSARSAVVEACLSQGAAKTAQELVVFSVDTSTRRWKQIRDLNLAHVKTMNRPDMVDYYSKLIPFIYGYRWLSPVKWLMFNIGGLFRPMPREPVGCRDRQEVAVKSCALACENFMLAIAAQGFDTCPMEGLDSARMRRALGLSRSSVIVMAISVGERTERGLWGPQFRVPREMVVHEV